MYEDALKTVTASIPDDVLRKTPLPRIVKSLSWKTKLWLSAKKAIAAFILSGGAALAAGATPMHALLAGIGGAVVYGGKKAISEHAKDKVLDKTVRNVLAKSVVSDSSLQLVHVIMTLAMRIAPLMGFDLSKMLRDLSTSLATLSDVPKEVMECLLTASIALSEDSPGGATLTADELTKIINEATDVVDAVHQLRAKIGGRIHV